MKRRNFLIAAASPGALPLLAGAESDPVTFEPILEKKLFPDPVRIASLDLFHREGTWMIRARSTEGVEGWAVGHPGKSELCAPVFSKVVAPFLKGKDARDLDRLVDEVYLAGSNYKMQGQLFWVAVAAAEFAILDLLGKTVGLSSAEMLGGARRDSFDLYIANNHRQLDAKESLRKIIASVESIDAKAVKYKIGGRMKVDDQVPGRTEALIPLVSEALGDRCTLYADANSSYPSVKRAIEIGRILEANEVAFYEEPCPFDYLDETREVADALEIPIAWGEQESSQWRFQKMIQQGGVQVPQPDLFYYGGLIRSLRVAKMAGEAGLDCTPHISGGGWGFLYTGIYAACCPNPGPHQEYKGINRAFPWENTGRKIEVKNGAMTAPNGPGLGAEIDPDFTSKLQPVRS